MNNAIESSQSPFVTGLAWLVIVLSGVTVLMTLLQISLMALAIGPIAFALPISILSYATPAMTLAAGVGLLNRRRWARSAIVAILVAAILLMVASFVYLDPNAETEVLLGSGETSRVVFAPRSTFFYVAGLLTCSLCIYVLCRTDVKTEFDD